ncbi:MAG: DUF4143 domain-containing protein [Bacteroidota bacterium]
MQALTFYELTQRYSLPEIDEQLEKRIIFGNYVEVVESEENQDEVLIDVLQKIILTQLGDLGRINKGEQLLKVLQVIAFNVGEVLSYNEIGTHCQLDNETVERYIDLMEKTEVLIQIPSMSNGFRYELKKSNVFYFLDNGVRNALIRNFNSSNFRNDMDALWRNWLIAERIKWNRKNNIASSYYFWKTHTQQSIDFIEQTGERMLAYKFSWEKYTGKKPKVIKFPKQFLDSYPTIRTSILNRSTYWSFIIKK